MGVQTRGAAPQHHSQSPNIDLCQSGITIYVIVFIVAAVSGSVWTLRGPLGGEEGPAGITEEALAMLVEG